jgi:hypothetical protein
MVMEGMLQRSRNFSTRGMTDSDGIVDDEALGQLLREGSKKKRKTTNAKAASEKQMADTQAVIKTITEMNHGMVEILKTTKAIEI